MSTGIFQNIKKVADLQVCQQSGFQNDSSSEQPTLADLVLPGTGYSFSDEFACLLNVLEAKRESL